MRGGGGSGIRGRSRDILRVDAKSRRAGTPVAPSFVLEVAEKVSEDTESAPQALKRRHIFNGLSARLKSCPSQNLCEAEFLPSLCYSSES
jgi:hypothetical protein